MAPPPTPTRQREHLAALARRYPHAWQALERFRADKGRAGLPDWPDWCWVPMAGAYAVVSGGGQMKRSQAVDVSAVAALGAWRLGQGIYRFDPALYAPLIDTPIDRDIPHQVLYHLPEWCVYIETPGLSTPDSGIQLHGAYVHLEHDVARNGRPELRLLLDTDLMLLPLPLHLGDWPLAESLARVVDQAKANALTRGASMPDAGDLVGQTLTLAAPILSLTLYLCSQAAEIGDGLAKPAHAKAKQVKGGPRWFAAERPAVWDVGQRIGAALRRAYAAQETGQGGTHAGPRPHVRRAHWHTFRAGPRLDAQGQPIAAELRRSDLRWLPPIPVALDPLTDPASLPAVVHPVKAPPTPSAGG